MSTCEKIRGKQTSRRSHFTSEHLCWESGNCETGDRPDKAEDHGQATLLAELLTCFQYLWRYPNQKRLLARRHSLLSTSFFQHRSRGESKPGARRLLGLEEAAPTRRLREHPRPVLLWLDCPGGNIGHDKRLLRLRNDGKVTCIGCLRCKK